MRRMYFVGLLAGAWYIISCGAAGASDESSSTSVTANAFQTFVLVGTVASQVSTAAVQQAIKDVRDSLQQRGQGKGQPRG